MNKYGLNIPKLIVAVLAMVCATVLAAIGRIAGDAAIGVNTGVMMYIIGNGVAARSGKPVEPIIGNRTRYGRRADDQVTPR